MKAPRYFDNLPDDEKVMTAEEVAAFLKISAATVRRWTRQGKLKGYKLGSGGDWRYIKKDVINFLQ